MKRRTFALLLLAAMCGAVFGAPEPHVIRVSMVQLLATPERFEGKLVSVEGFLVLDFEDTTLYLHKEDQQNNLVQNAIWVDESPDMFAHRSELNHHYVELAGKFTTARHGHGGLFFGTLSDVRWAGRVPGAT